MRYLLIVLVLSFLLPARINLMPSDDFYGLETSEGTINHTIKEFILSGQSVDDLPSFIMKYGDIKLESDRSFIWGNQTYYVGNNTLNEKRRRFNENDRVVVYALFKSACNCKGTAATRAQHPSALSISRFLSFFLSFFLSAFSLLFLLDVVVVVG